MGDSNTTTTFVEFQSPATTVMDIPSPSPPSSPPSAPPTDNSFSSPASVLPLVISLATLVTIIIAACVIYRKRQTKRSQELARQLRVTERKIDAIGNLKAKKEQELLGLANRKVEYKPPATAPCSSVTSLESQCPNNREAAEVKFVVPLSQRIKEEEATTSSTEYELKMCEASVEVVKATSSSVPSTYTNTQSHEGDENDGSSSYYCSTYQGSAGATTVELGQGRSKMEVGDLSMAVECETIPSASSLSTVIGTVLSQPNHVTRSQSDHRHMTTKQPPHIKRLSAISAWTHVQNYSHIVRNLRYGSKYRSTHQGNSNTSSKGNPVSHAGTWGATSSHTYSTINGPLSTTTAGYFAVPPQGYGSRTASSSRREEGSGRPNTPVSNVTDITTDTDGEKEKWV